MQKIPKPTNLVRRSLELMSTFTETGHGAAAVRPLYRPISSGQLAKNKFPPPTLPIYVYITSEVKKNNVSHIYTIFSGYFFFLITGDFDNPTLNDNL